jgi:peptidoglycan-associated lipoprotein
LAAYNKQLGRKRGETVKSQLLANGVAEHRMKVVRLGEEGVLCFDDSNVCRHMNRRVPLEIRKIGQEHMAMPAAAASSYDSDDAGTKKTSNVEKSDSPTENLVPLNPEPVPGS